jgi:hypothetical protein
VNFWREAGGTLTNKRAELSANAEMVARQSQPLHAANRRGWLDPCSKFLARHSIGIVGPDAAQAELFIKVRAFASVSSQKFI